MRVEVVYIDKDVEFVAELDVAEGATVKTALEQSDALNQHTNISLEENQVGIFSKIVSLDTVLQVGDRVEVYRSLTIDPMESRRLRAKT